MKSKKIITLLLLLIGFTGMQAQQAFSSTVGDMLGNGSVSYSVGQLLYTTNIGPNNTIAQGIQQAFEISTIAGFEKLLGINLAYSVFPNPTSNSLQINVDAKNALDVQSMTYQLVNLEGKLLEANKLKTEITNIDMSHLVASTYFIHVIQGKKALKTFKIIKTN